MGVLWSSSSKSAPAVGVVANNNTTDVEGEEVDTTVEAKTAAKGAGEGAAATGEAKAAAKGAVEGANAVVPAAGKSDADNPTNLNSAGSTGSAGSAAPTDLGNAGSASPAPALAVGDSATLHIGVVDKGLSAPSINADGAPTLPGVANGVDGDASASNITGQVATDGQGGGRYKKNRKRSRKNIKKISKWSRRTSRSNKNKL